MKADAWPDEPDWGPLYKALGSRLRSLDFDEAIARCSGEGTLMRVNADALAYPLARLQTLSLAMERWCVAAPQVVGEIIPGLSFHVAEFVGFAGDLIRDAPDLLTVLSSFSHAGGIVAAGGRCYDIGTLQKLRCAAGEAVAGVNGVLAGNPNDAARSLLQVLLLVPELAMASLSLMAELREVRRPAEQ